MTNVNDFNTNYPIDGTVKSTVAHEQLSAGGEIFILNDNKYHFGHGILYVDGRGEEHMFFMTGDAYQNLVGEMVRWMR